MKRQLCVLTMAVLALAATAQGLSALEQLKADPRKAYGPDYPYSFDAPAQTKAPKGYKSSYWYFLLYKQI